MPFLVNIERSPNFKEHAMLFLSNELFDFFFFSKNEFFKYFNKCAHETGLVENPRVTQPNQNQVIKEKSVQSMRDVLKSKLKILAFVH